MGGGPGLGRGRVRMVRLCGCGHSADPSCILRNNTSSFLPVRSLRIAIPGDGRLMTRKKKHLPDDARGPTIPIVVLLQRCIEGPALVGSGVRCTTTVGWTAQSKWLRDSLFPLSTVCLSFDSPLGSCRWVGKVS